MRCDLCIADHDAFLELVGRHRDHGELDFLVAAVELGRDVGVRHRDPVRERALQFFEDHAAPDLLLELARSDRRILHLQQLPIAIVADELTVLLERWQRQNPCSHFGVGRRNPLAARFGECSLFFDQLLNYALIDPELAEQAIVHVAAIGVPVGLYLLLIDAAKPPDRDVAALDCRDHAVVAGAVERLVLHEAGDVKGNERDDNNRKAPLEPVLVSAHPVEHRHR